MALPPTRILSWLQMVQQADPDFRRLSLRPWVYEFSNGRLFVDPLPLYGVAFMTDDFGTIMQDDSGNQMQSDQGGMSGGGGGGGGTSTGTSTGFIFGTSPFGSGSF